MSSDPTPEPSPAAAISRRKVLTWAGVGVVGAGAVSAGVIGIASNRTGTTATDTGPSVTAGFLTPSRLHTVSLTVPEGDLTAMVATYTSSGEKTWLKATVTIDGTTYSNVGVRLKGNSSLMQLLGGGKAGQGAPATSGGSAPQGLPWLIRLDKYATGQSHDGLHELVVRSSTTSSALNEAVALDLLAAAGLESQKAAYLRFSVNGSSPVLRLAVENPAGDWAARLFTGSGTLYKADATGDYTYRGTDTTSYDTAWDIDAGTEDWKPLISFLDFVNNSSDADFAAGLVSRLDTTKFATYLAFESVIDNVDDIDGPGNNSMLWWSSSTSAMTLLAWDHNLAFGATNGAGMGRQQGQQQNQPGAVPSGMPQGGLPSGMPRAGASGAPANQGNAPTRQGGIGGKANALVTRFTAAHAADIATAKTTLTQSLLRSGTAKTSLTTWSALATASGLVTADTVTSEGATILAYLG